MTKKATLRDVAREAGVSVATVSYIMNNRTDQKISEATRKKVLQIANLLDYTPNSTAKSLATGRSNLIGIACQLSPHTPSRNQDLSLFLQHLAARFHPLGYDLLMMPAPFAEGNAAFHHSVDAVIAIDLAHEDFVRLADNVFVPVISVDMQINDKLFYQIMTDFPRLLAAMSVDPVRPADSEICLILDRYHNENYLQFIVDSLTTSQVLYTDQLTPSTLGSLRDKNVIAIGSYTGMLLQAYVEPTHLTVIQSHSHKGTLPDGIQQLSYDISQKAEITVEIVRNALDKKFDLPHDIKV